MKFLPGIDLRRAGLYLFIAITLFWPDRNSAQFSIKGFCDWYQAVRINKPHDYLSSRTRVRTELAASRENASLFTSLNIIKNEILPQNSGFHLREAYIDYQGTNWDIRIGRQIIIWGNADGIQITDIVSPMDYTEFLAQDYDDIRMPVEGVKTRYNWNQASLEMVWIPVFQSDIFPAEDNPWAFKMNLPTQFPPEFEPAILPEKKVANSDFGGKISFFLPGFDFNLSTLYTWDKTPVMSSGFLQRNDSSYISIQPQYHRLFFVGQEISWPIGAFVIRGENAFFRGKHFESKNPNINLFKKNTLHWLAGIDWYPGREWNLSAQFSDLYILDYDSGINTDRHSILATFSISKNLLRNTLTLSSFAYYGFNDHETFARFQVRYALTDEIAFESGADVFIGNTGLLGQFKDNNEVFFKAKYSF
ncbi:hypothetical protein JW964_18820 [candidate division KSB1 bacterium]|nr:hypothetical protein [candidate division KSB1 bacterium]